MSLQTILGNFALILFVLSVITGVIWFLDTFYLARERRAKADLALAEFDSRVSRLAADGVKTDTNGRAELEANLLRQPGWIEYSGSFFPVIALIFCLRSFLFEPFKIPSSSMVPTLVVGDLILVNKFTYGIRLPVVNRKVIEINPIQRGDVVVFRYPADPSVYYIKRVVGLPGDKVVYRGKRLTINGESIAWQPSGYYTDSELNFLRLPTFAEKLGEKNHQMMIVPAQPPVDLAQVRQFAHRENCEYNDDGFSCTVPAGNYFMMGDNRDQSSDSRYWGFVPDGHIKGRAFLVWMNFGDFKRIGNGIE